MNDQFVRPLNPVEKLIYDRYTRASNDGTRACFSFRSMTFYLQSAEGSAEEVEDFRRALASALLLFYEDWYSLENSGKGYST